MDVALTILLDLGSDQRSQIASNPLLTYPMEPAFTIYWPGIAALVAVLFAAAVLNSETLRRGLMKWPMRCLHSAQDKADELQLYKACFGGTIILASGAMTATAMYRFWPDAVLCAIAAGCWFFISKGRSGPRKK